MNARKKVEEIEKIFQRSNIEIADAEWIVCEITGYSKMCLSERQLTEAQIKKIDKVVKKRLKHIPIAQIFKKRNFYGLDLYINKNVLIPRFETEGLCELIAKELPADILGQLHGLDVGCGSGAICIVLSKLFGYKMTAVDISNKALKVAKKNAKKYNVNINYLRSNMLSEVKNYEFDFVVSNPPYILSSELKNLDKEVVGFEPKLALDGGGDGLQFYRKIIEDAPYVLKNDGYLFFEVGKGMANEVVRLMRKDFYAIKINKDLQGVDRYVFGKLKERKI